jgi:hypothetical protein
VASFRLQPCKLREQWLVPSKEPAFVLSWPELCAKLAPSKDERALRALQLIQIGSYVGLVSRPPKMVAGPPSNFVLLNHDRSGNLGAVLSKDPTLGPRLVEVYRVEEVQWDARVVEIGSRQ